MRLRSFARAGHRVAFVSLIGAAAVSGACAHEFDTTSRAPARLSLGDDMFQTLCDRVAATEDPFDLEARKARVVCHPDADGKYGDTYGREGDAMPVKLAVMVKYRPQLIDAFNATIPDKDNLQTDLKDLLAAITPLYDDDTMPESTRTLAAIFDQIAFNQTKPSPDESPRDANIRKTKLQRAGEVRAALARLGGRKGYRPISTAIGVGKPMLAYDRMSALTDTTIRMLGTGGPAQGEMELVLKVAQHELANTKVSDARPPLTGYTDRFSKTPNARAKLTSEVLKNLLVDVEKADFRLGMTASVPYLLRDARGFAAFLNKPAGWVDKDGDGLPDVDTNGRFIDDKGAPLAIPAPFAFVTLKGVESEVSGATGKTDLYRFGDASQTMLHSVLADTKVLAHPDNGALLDLAHAAKWQFGKRVDAEASYPSPDGAPDTVKVAYKKFDAASSPITDLVYALGRFLELPRLNDYLEFNRQLLRDHPQEVARLVGAVMKIRDIANKPEYASIDLDNSSILWDEVVKIVGELAGEPLILREVVESFADPRVLLLPQGMAKFAIAKDGLDYNPAGDTCWPAGTMPDAKCPALNDPWWNVSVTPPGAKKDPNVRVNYGLPDTEDNRSLFSRFLALINDSAGVRACNKQGGSITTKFLGISVKLPLFGTYDECESLNIPDLGNFYLGCIAGGTDEVTGKPRCKLPISDGMVSVMNTIVGSGQVDNLVEQSSGITGLKQTATVEALNRMVMWRNPNKFVSDLTDPMPTNVCPIATSLGTRRCATKDDLLMYRHRATIFMGEAYDSVKGLAPTILPFVKKRADNKGREHYFVGLIQAFHRHWSPSKDGNKVRCDPSYPNNAKLCMGSNARAYEPILAEAFATDIIPALHEVTKIVRTMNVNGKNGAEVLTAMVRDLMDPKVAATMKLVDRNGSASTVYNDGKTTVPQLTYYHLFANAINKFDTMWGPEGEKDHELWRAARSKLVDQFLGVEAVGGDVTKSKFKNPAVTAAGPVLMDVLEDRVAEHKAKGDFTTWAQGGMTKTFMESLESPIFATAIDLQEKIYGDEAARKELGLLLAYLADQGSQNDALASLLTSAQDLIQLMNDDADMVPLYHALAIGAAPQGAVKKSLDLIERIGKVETGDKFASTHGSRRVIPKVLANAMTPMKSGITPIEVFVDVVADLHRADPTSTGAFAPVDYGTVSRNMQEFLVDPTRGLEQLYVIVKNRYAN